MRDSVFKFRYMEPRSCRRYSFIISINEKGGVTTNNAEIQRIIRDYYEQLYGNQIDNLEEMDRFLEKFS